MGGIQIMRLFGRKDKELFKLFSDSSRVVLNGGKMLQNVINDYTDLDVKIARLTSMEHEGDRIIQDLVQKLNTRFILPFDREEALQLVQKIAVTLDYITGVVDRMILYRTGQPGKQVKDMVDVLMKSLILQEKSFNLLIKVEKNNAIILEYCEEIRLLEKQQDNLYRSGLAYLFENIKEPIDIIKWREIYEHIEMAQDNVQDVADLITNICIKYS